jgi:hypothetical protein
MLKNLKLIENFDCLIGYHSVECDDAWRHGIEKNDYTRLSQAGGLKPLGEKELGLLFPVVLDTVLLV